MQFVILGNSWETDYFWSVFSNCFGLILFGLTLGLMIVIIVYLWPNYALLSGNEEDDEMEKDYFVNKFSQAYANETSPDETQDSEHSKKWSMIDPLFYYIRRWIFAFVVIFLNDYPFFQIAFLIINNLIELILEVFDIPSFFYTNNSLEMYNNYSILLITQCMLCFTDWVYDPDARTSVGWVMIILTSQNILVNLFLTSKQIVMDGYSMLKLLCHLRKHRNKMSTRLMKTMLKRKVTKFKLFKEEE